MIQTIKKYGRHLLYTLLCVVFPRYSYKLIARSYRYRSIDEQKELLKILPTGVTKFDLTSYFRSLHKNNT